MIDLRVLELICARFTHELVSPVGAVANGIELLGEDDPDFVREALQLVGQSARTASRRLQFYRFAYGTLPAAASVKPDELLLGFLDGGKVEADWTGPVSALSQEWQRLACNLAAIAAECLVRGGKITLRSLAAPATGIAVEAVGETALVNADLASALSGKTDPAALTARTVHGYLTAKLAERLNATAALSESSAGRALFVARSA
jgi:histidine phosphotransferase ChpT